MGEIITTDLPERRIFLCLAHMSGKEAEYIDNAFKTNWVTPLGPNVDGFENDLALFLGNNKKVAALSSGTAALHLGLLLLGVKAGDEVLCQSFTFCASANPVLYIGANPVFIDSEDDSWNMSPILLEQAIQNRIEVTGRKPKAIIVVHLYGMPAKMQEIMEISEKYDIPVLEDAAEALGSTYAGCECGTLGTLGVLSFNGNKMITTSGGGALVVSTDELKQKALFYATQARENYPYYQHEEIGYNYRLSNISAGIGRGQMTILNDHIAHHRHIHSLYQSLLHGIGGITLKSNYDSIINSNYWLSCILIDESITGVSYENLRLKLDEKNIETRPLWKPMHLQPVYKNCPDYTDGTAERLFNSGLCLPSGPCVTDNDVEFIVNQIKQILNCL